MKVCPYLESARNFGQALEWAHYPLLSELPRLHCTLFRYEARFE